MNRGQPVGTLADYSNAGTLFAFAVVCGAVLVLRYSNPTQPRPFRVPAAHAVCGLGVASCLLLMLSLPAQNWYRLFVWMAIGLIIYFGYGRTHSIAQRSPPASPTPPTTQEQADYGEPPRPTG